MICVHSQIITAYFSDDNFLLLGAQGPNIISYHKTITFTLGFCLGQQPFG